jgi:hypothetical protein
MRLIRAQPFVATEAGIVEQDEAATVNGHPAPLMAFVRYKGDPQPVIADGRAPSAPDEIALGRDLMRVADVHIGDSVDVAPTEGSTEKSRTMTVTGEVVLENPITPSMGAGDGAVVSPEVMASLTPSSVAQSIVVAFAPGVDRDEAIDRLASVYPGSIHLVAPQEDLRNLQRLHAVPWAIAGLLALLALATLVHALVTMVSTNRRSLAMLTVLGAHRTMRSRVMSWAAAFTVAGAVVVGVPVGLVAGRALWRFLADGISIPGEPVTPVLTTLGLVAGVVVISEVVAWAAVRRVAGRNLAAELRRD